MLYSSFTLAAALLAPAPTRPGRRHHVGGGGPRDDSTLPFQVFTGTTCEGGAVGAVSEDRSQKGKRCFNYRDVGSLKIKDSAGCYIALWPGENCQGKEWWASSLLSDSDETVTSWTHDWSSCLNTLYASVQLYCPSGAVTNGWLDY